MKYLSVKLIYLLFIYFAADALCAVEKEDPHYKERAQFYKWFLLFERPNLVKEDEYIRSITSEDVVLDIYGNRSRGREGVHALLNHVRNWNNSHHIKKIDTIKTTGELNLLSADVLYQNVFPSGARNNILIRYKVGFEYSDPHTPVFNTIQLSEIKKQEGGGYVDAYNTNVAYSIVYAWLAMLSGETPVKQFSSEYMEDKFRCSSLSSATEDDSLCLSAYHFNPKMYEIESVTITENVGKAIGFRVVFQPNDKNKKLTSLATDWSLTVLDEGDYKVSSIKFLSTNTQ
ncbi:hypothetical protein [Gilvimarinus algae]|uniref:Uncharacterized protein n=1 Tax=Gilvimarinus algae TaxID=3058037 RepID=A0ABT8TAH9_9GAMM|nr:hypothetical protein [Gilvimarinus sp. SDUM040014]MDO3380910.1 hypothetical protein [Gilvimarinus sp. SDUM040014]